MLTSASGRPRWSQWYRWIFPPACTPGPSGFASAPPSGRTCQPAAAFLTHPVSKDFTFQPSSICTSTGGNTTSPPSSPPAAEAHPPGCGAAFSPAHRWQFNSDEWREAPRLINRLDAGSSFCIVVSRSPSQPYQVTSGSVTATSSPSGPVHAAIPVLPPAAQRVVKIATFDQRLCILCRV